MLRSALLRLTLLLGLVLPAALWAQASLHITPSGLAHDRRTTSVEALGTLENGRLHLTLDSAIQRALENNVGLMVQRYQLGARLAGVLRSRSLFDLQVDGTLSTSESSRPTNSTLQDTDLLVEETERWELRLSQQVASGGQASMRFNNSRSDSSDGRVSPNPAYDLDLQLSFAQPLLRGRGRQITRQPIVVARRNAEIGRENFQLEVERLIQEVSNAYWNLVQQLQLLEVAKESLRRAEEFHELNLEKIDAGVLRPIELVQSETGVASRQLAILRSEVAIGNASDELRRLVHLETGSDWDLVLVPVTEPDAEVLPEVDLEAAIATALDQRPDLRVRQIQNEILDLDARVARNAALPGLELSASYGLNARDGDRLQGDGTIRSAGYGDAFDLLTEADFNSWTLQLSVSYPLQNRDARGRAAVAQLEAARGALEMRDLELRVITGVRRAVRELESAIQGISTARLARELEEKNLEGTRLSYEHGIVNSLDVLTVQANLADARGAEVNALLDYRRAETEYHRALGELLAQHGIELAEEP